MVFVPLSPAACAFSRGHFSIWPCNVYDNCVLFKMQIFFIHLKRSLHVVPGTFHGVALSSLTTNVHNHVDIDLHFEFGIYTSSFLLCFFHSIHSCLMSPSEQAWSVNIWMSFILVITDLNWYNPHIILTNLFFFVSIYS